MKSRLHIIIANTVSRKNSTNDGQDENPDSGNRTLGTDLRTVPWRPRNRQMINLAQSSHIPENGKLPTLRDVPWLTAFAIRGFYELVRARLIFSKLEAKAIPERNQQAKAKSLANQAVPPATLARITYVIPRLSDRFPWRSDCVIQAIAAQNWLSSYGAASEIQIGVENPKDGEFGAHAWLVHRESVITGGDIDRYHVILAESGEDN
ncbi:MAG: lasso peptide biosynthesis B2 protein [Erythrobacter sp.]|uniref:lasso peptide biosynthesis B2 protein n=1 Tax=Erythrobacter sp. TaxID=1042 RepID=UPI00326775AA